jgi:hypothetical protein
VVVPFMAQDEAWLFGESDAMVEYIIVVVELIMERGLMLTLDLWVSVRALLRLLSGLALAR